MRLNPVPPQSVMLKNPRRYGVVIKINVLRRIALVRHGPDTVQNCSNLRFPTPAEIHVLEENYYTRGQIIKAQRPSRKVEQ